MILKGTKFIKPNGVILIVDDVVGDNIHFHEQSYPSGKITSMRNFHSMCEELEFNIGDTVTLDRYNHIDDVESVKVVGYGSMLMSNRLTYKMDVRGIKIDSTGGSIMESKLYDPVPDDERHCKIGVSPMEQEKFWDKALGRTKK